ncbi:iron ABC transporter permease [Halorhodospira sp. 9621]|uniref:FecCD family ABC transporter permease n=1 Tax=Halorhodospira TaxID=85108 RepID=UPI001EE90F5B|nr:MULTISPECIES: iron ABC transporter permease [Halorhodospira]MCG5532663.1 iron ABC transporter permease [Halorhodospira sp. 9621]MCG5537689.1 iron ABC transporter permease [Halorhodospira sp. 9622]
MGIGRTADQRGRSGAVSEEGGALAQSSGVGSPVRFLLPLGVLALAALLAVATAVAIGSVPLTPGEVLAVLAGSGEPLHQTLVLELRLPRALAAFAVGGLLAVAGALMQVLLRNPLADPYVLGLSGGAAVGALAAMLLGLGMALVSGAAFVGALFSTLLVFGLAHGTGSWTPTRLLLTGVVVASGWGALVTFMLAVGPTEQLPGMLYWLMGDLAYARSPWLALAALAVAVLVALPLGRSLNVLARGPLQAAALGVAVRPLEWAVYVAASVLTAVAVTTAGSIGFVGLVVPHMLRLVLGNDQRLILPAAALAGGALLALADVFARTLIAPEQLPVGVITAMLGVPLFLYLLHRSR